RNSAYYGMALLSPTSATSYRAIKNADFIWPGFTDANKYLFMANGLEVTQSDGPNDWSHLLSAGPFDIPPDGSVTVVYAILGGENLADLTNNAEAAQNIYFSTDLNKQITGRVYYYFADRPVANAVITLNGLVTDVTDALGLYGFSNPSQGLNNLAIKKAGDHRNAISGVDALLLLQDLAFIRTLDKNQSKAADVSQDNTINGGDALAIQKFLAFMPTHTAQTGQWLFSPADTTFNLVKETNINFNAYLLGDLNGDWGVTSNFNLTSTQKFPENFIYSQKNETSSFQTKAVLILPENAGGDPGTTIPVPIKVSTDSTIGLVQFVVEYDSTVIKFKDAQIGSDVVNFAVSQINTDLPFSPSGTGTNQNVLLQISGGGTSTFSGTNQEVVILNFDVADGVGAQTPLIFDRVGDRTFLTTSNLANITGNEIEFVDGMSVVTPVELISFAGFPQDNQVELVWQTATELNNFGFEIERSFIAQSQYVKIAFIRGSGTTSRPQQYHYIDKGLAPGNYLYRLKQIDTDGSFDYSGII
ncbi:MAG: cohesin domain-containing protein, partial [bacterium]